MKQFLILMIILRASIGCFSQTPYSYTVTSIEGVNKPLNACQGKKLLLVTLPLQQSSSNDSLLHALDSLQIVAGSSLVVIGVPSYEDGYMPSAKSNLQNWYRSILNTNIIITEGLYTRKTSGSQQHPLFKWLTSKEENQHFDIDVTGPKCKFVVWTTGELIGVLDSHTKISGIAMNDLLQ